MKRVRRKGKFSVECEKIGIENIWYFLKVRYGKDYSGQLLIKNPEKTIPVMIKTLESHLKKVKTLNRLNKRKK